MELGLLLFDPRDLFFRDRLVPAVGAHGLELAQPIDAPLDRHEIGQEPAEPALIHVEHSAALGFLGDHVLGLPFRAHEEDRASFGREFRHKLLGATKQLRGCSEVDDVNAVPLAEDIRLHLRVPPFGLVAEVHTSVQEIFHRERRQGTSPPSMKLQRAA